MILLIHFNEKLGYLASLEALHKGLDFCPFFLSDLKYPCYFRPSVRSYEVCRWYSEEQCAVICAHGCWRLACKQRGKLLAWEHESFPVPCFQRCPSSAVQSLAIKSLEARTEARRDVKSPMILSHNTPQCFSIRNVQIFMTLLRDVYTNKSGSDLETRTSLAYCGSRLLYGHAALSTIRWGLQFLLKLPELSKFGTNLPKSTRLIPGLKFSWKDCLCDNELPICGTDSRS